MIEIIENTLLGVTIFVGGCSLLLWMQKSKILLIIVLILAILFFSYILGGSILNPSFWE